MEEYDKSSSQRKMPNPFVVITLIVLIFAAVLFAVAGTLKWWQGWAFISIYAIFMFISASQLKKDPQLLARRVNVEQDAIAKKCQQYSTFSSWLFH